ncbi:UDP-4-amino-4,6-dideoxy-N-acetyl-beta-L-altrosamine N-acetyltransferase [Caulobacter sp. 17J80-11]|uniref:UDP-4-amino-4, 6-dideoxy-N-acetyl-beta-L-altrosamine N-acetyltransferase n=1 Tax=Caulobacter sp. 17J80-11 TaxID=2763502 RepID=UPI001653D732|nr:UDP-4-amino-4,6-dideoxy-N-acetyl-beta-L-altrosamine N-acetyltransferase [Caulobacter sp. 17J80-11]MBC6980603.1 UDP-4-amino-4,6-dideoxy-N-acetyl-beta-L-altrosamine N-acetyltransferase [Caulobacter sp. 17J80-11]
MIQLRDLTEDDSERLFLWRREPEVDRWMCGRAAQTLDEHERWFDRFREDSGSRGWIIVHGERPVGFLTLRGLDGCDRRAEWGWYIGDADARGRGVGRAAQALGLDRAFDDLGLNKVWAEVLADNETALKAQAAAGFRREGYLRSHTLKGDRFRDVVLLAMLADEWRARRPAYVRGLTASRLIAA